MRPLMLGVAAIACAPLHDPSGCPRPCPPSCPGACLPSGFCPQARWEPDPTSPVVRVEGTTLQFALGDLPPSAGVAVSLHGVVDLVARGQTIPWDYWIEIDFADAAGNVRQAIDQSAFNAVDFPVVGDWSGETRTDASGVVDVRLLFVHCLGRSGRVTEGQGCALLAGSYLTVRLVDAAPWETAPCQ